MRQPQDDRVPSKKKQHPGEHIPGKRKKERGTNNNSGNNPTENTGKPGYPEADEALQGLVQDYTAHRQLVLMQMKRGEISREEFLYDVKQHLKRHYTLPPVIARRVMRMFEQFVFGYSRLSPLIDDPAVSDIRCVSYDNIRIKKKGHRMASGVAFSTEKEYRQFIDYVATRNQVSLDNLNAIQRFTDTESHPDFILRFTVSMPLVNTYEAPYLCVRKIRRAFPTIHDLIQERMLDWDTAQLLIDRFSGGSTLICGGNSSGKTTLLNALKETLPEDMAMLVAQQADELTTKRHPDMMFLHSLPNAGENKAGYDLKDISIAGLTMDVDFFIVGEIKGEEALYLLNAAYTGQICAGTIHAPSASKALNKLVDYAMYASRYSRSELLKMMECFRTVVFMKGYRVSQIYDVTGWNEERQELEYITLYDTDGINQMHMGNHAGGESISAPHIRGRDSDEGASVGRVNRGRTGDDHNPL
jgi:pilus assembly protein CpaF